MHPTSGEAATWRHEDKREGYWQRRWWEGSRPDRKQQCQLEHRWVWEAETGEKLTPDIHIHHKDGNHANNAFENLERMTPTEHRALHGPVRTVGDQRQCSRCEQWYPLAVYRWKTATLRGCYCPDCYRVLQRGYRQRPEARARRNAYQRMRRNPTGRPVGRPRKSA